MAFSCFGGGSGVLDGGHQVKSVQAGCSFSFSGGGFLIPYYVGVCKELMEHGVINKATPACGSSAGALAATCVASGMTPGQMRDSVTGFVTKLRDGVGLRGRLGSMLRAHLEVVVPLDVIEQSEGKLTVCLTKVAGNQRGGRLFKTHRITKFKDRSDLIDALCTSCYIPYYSDAGFSTTFRGEPRWMDGGGTNMMPEPPPCPQGGYAVKVCCIPMRHMNKMVVFNKARQVGGIAIAPDVFAPFPITLGAVTRAAFAPADDSFLDRLEAQGVSDARAWLQRVGNMQGPGPVPRLLTVSVSAPALTTPAPAPALVPTPSMPAHLALGQQLPPPLQLSAVTPAPTQLLQPLAHPKAQAQVQTRMQEQAQPNAQPQPQEAQSEAQAPVSDVEVTERARGESPPLPQAPLPPPLQSPLQLPEVVARAEAMAGTGDEGSAAAGADDDVAAAVAVVVAMTSGQGVGQEGR